MDLNFSPDQGSQDVGDPYAESQNRKVQIVKAMDEARQDIFAELFEVRR